MYKPRERSTVVTVILIFFWMPGKGREMLADRNEV